MGIYHGKGGIMTFPDAGAITDLLSWSASATADTADTTAMTDTYESHEIGLTDFSVTAETLAQTTTDVPTTYIGKDGALVLSCSASHYFTANAICTGVTESVTIDDVGKLAFTFEGNDTGGLVFT